MIRSYIEEYLDIYLTTEVQFQRVPLLIGPSAVAKSAIIKDRAAAHGYRLEDIRVSFISRLDVQGLGEFIKNGVSITSYNAPAAEFLKCTDVYIDYCRNCIPKLKSLLLTMEENGEDTTEIRDVLTRYEYEAKAPVMFFDEITRCGPDMRHVLTKLLLDKSFMGLPMTYARVICATNSADSFPERLRSVFQVSEPDDPAYLDRFEPLVVNMQTMRDTWLKWVKGNLHKKIFDFLDKNPEYCYDISTLEAIPDAEMEKLSVTPYANYRTWEFLSKYITWAEINKEPIFKNIVYSLIGSEVGKAFTQEYQIEDNSANIDVYLHQCIESGIPLMLTAVTGLGKTARVNQYCKAHNYELVEINLSEMDRVDLMGYPVKLDVHEYIAGTIEDSRILAILAEESSKLNLPLKITTKAPKSELVNKLDRARAEGRKVVIFFDELNRVQNEILMSAVFSAISDASVMGVQFDPAEVAIVSACNIGEYGDTKELDPAFVSRFCIFAHQSYTPEDYQVLIDYFKDQGYDSLLLRFLESVENGHEMLNSIMVRTMAQAKPSTRAFSDLNALLKTESPLITGGVIFANQVCSQERFDLTYAKTAIACPTIMARYRKLKDRWCGAGRSNVMDEFPGTENKAMYMAWLDQVASVESEIVNVRRSIIQSIIGDQATAFCDFYNQFAGLETRNLKVEDLKTSTDVRDFIAENISFISIVDEKLRLANELLTSIWTKHKTDLPREAYKTGLIEVCRQLTSSDVIATYLSIVGKNISLSLLWSYISDSEFYKDLYEKAGLAELYVERTENLKPILLKSLFKGATA